MRNIRNISSLLGLITLSFILISCADVSRIDNNSPTYSVNCTGWPNTMEDCNRAAKNYCPTGYTVLSNQPVNVDNVVMLAKAIDPNRVQLRGLIIRCK